MEGGREGRVRRGQRGTHAEPLRTLAGEQYGHSPVAPRPGEGVRMGSSLREGPQPRDELGGVAADKSRDCSHVRSVMPEGRCYAPMVKTDGRFG